jgi:hypothetical protein
MASSILNSDDGVISGTAGLKSVGGDDGVLVFQSKGTETARINTDKQIVAAAGTASLPIYSTTGDTNTGIFFPAADTIAFAEGGAEAMRIDSSGRLLIGTNSGTRKLTVYENAAQVDVSIVSSTSGLAILQMGDTAADNQGQIVYRNNGDSMEFAANGSERMRITSDGYLRMASGTGGIQFGGDTAAANALDDYEEGTWTPVLNFGGSSTGITYDQSERGYYTKVGNIVTVFVRMVLSSKGAQTGAATITGLPFTSKGAQFVAGCSLAGFNDLTFADQLILFITEATTTVFIGEVTNAGARTDITNSDFANNTRLSWSATYLV